MEQFAAFMQGNVVQTKYSLFNQKCSKYKSVGLHADTGETVKCVENIEIYFYISIPQNGFQIFTA